MVRGGLRWDDEVRTKNQVAQITFHKTGGNPYFFVPRGGARQKTGENAVRVNGGVKNVNQRSCGGFRENEGVKTVMAKTVNPVGLRN